MALQKITDTELDTYIAAHTEDLRGTHTPACTCGHECEGCDQCDCGGYDGTYQWVVENCDLDSVNA